MPLAHWQLVVQAPQLRTFPEVGEGQVQLPAQSVPPVLLQPQGVALTPQETSVTLEGTQPPWSQRPLPHWQLSEQLMQRFTFPDVGGGLLQVSPSQANLPELAQPQALP